jgi:hypothetical protein
MRRSSESLSDVNPAGFSSRTLAVRSYRQITEILAQRQRLALTPARVGHLCRTAEMKIAMGLLADPEVRARLRPSAAEGHRAMHHLRQCSTYLWHDLAVTRS